MHAHPLIAMRKTSHDGIDVTSITSGIENEIKKAGTKIKKSSKKRKGQNFSLEYDENIIEPLLQIDHEKTEISTKSAKYLLNKTKTDSSFEPINKSSENTALSANSISTPVSSTSKIINTPYISGTAPLHNHMNTNIFGMYDVSKDIVTTKNSILVEIDGSKSGGYNPSPLIFTTAKIHTDSKSKLMEPVQVTPVPILSTIEGNVVRTFPDNSEHHMSNLSTRPIDLNINKCGMSITSESNEIENKNIKELQTIHPVKDSTSSLVKNISKLSNKSTKIGNLPTSTNSVYSTTKTIRDEISIDSSTILKTCIDSAQNTNKVAKETSEESIKDTLLAQNSITTAKNVNNGISGENKALKPNMQFPLDIHVTDNKSKKMKSPNALSDMKENVTSAHRFSPLCAVIEKHDPISKTYKMPESSNDIVNIAKVSSSGSKRLQRQKNASIEDINETVTISNTLTNKGNKSQELDKNNIIKIDKASFNKGNNKNEDISPHEKTTISSKSTTKAETSTAVSSPLTIVSKPLVGTITKQEKRSSTDVENLRPLTGSAVEDCSKILNKSTNVIPVTKAKDDIKSLSITTEKSLSNVTTSSVMATFSKSVPTSSKEDVLVKYESSVETTTLPSYIVSTSRTKIGSTLTFNTITSTSKSLAQKTPDDVVYTTNGKEKKSTAAEQSNKITVGMPSNLTRSNNGSKQTKSKIDSSVKDGRA
ncbi:flocculation protein FLO11-like isoform X1 [Vanessa cardui]|uniref:flocculation protein FLO11-like isoform X1 n=1 Tax=Vanessa cardui TaxID=171605 RepID=UPI001F142D61|nr:flocculation protein FLO11-like isoform X1 [Vanessa cardui]